ncbi:hypothetical protein TNCV_5077051 [Trichonephila clavipes]|uniref:Uncharacterized protein n=1 Tax=Trichonephila clavipes TaxID=2585209 RepID=A0A8X6VAW6_TRICX|nr:hypothetical protein TNCV_5077051 [Trichonephila clavipes]
MECKQTTNGFLEPCCIRPEAKEAKVIVTVLTVHAAANGIIQTVVGWHLVRQVISENINPHSRQAKILALSNSGTC